MQATSALIPAIDQITSSTLRRSVEAAWDTSLETSPYASLDEVPYGPILPQRSLLLHVNEVNRRVIDFIAIATDEYGIALPADEALAATILHDVDKPLLYRWDGVDFSYADGRRARDHGLVGAELARRCGVPDDVALVIERHSPFNAIGPLLDTPAAVLLHHADLLSGDLGLLQFGARTIFEQTRLIHEPPMAADPTSLPVVPDTLG